LKEEALDRTLWRNGFGRGYGPVVGQRTTVFGFLMQRHRKNNVLVHYSENAPNLTITNEIIVIKYYKLPQTCGMKLARNW
jgi:hypothetical protein